MYYLLMRIFSLPSQIGYQLQQPFVRQQQFQTIIKITDPEQNQFFIRSVIPILEAYEIKLVFKNKDNIAQRLCHKRLQLIIQTKSLELQVLNLFRYQELNDYFTIDKNGIIKFIRIQQDRVKVRSQINLNKTFLRAMYNPKYKQLLLYQQNGLWIYDMEQEGVPQLIQQRLIQKQFISKQGIVYKKIDNNFFFFYNFKEKQKKTIQKLQFKLNDNITLPHYIQNFEVLRIFETDQNVEYIAVKGLQSQFVIQLINHTFNKIFRTCAQQIIALGSKVLMICGEEALLFNRNYNKNLQDNFFQNIQIGNFKNLIPFKKSKYSQQFIGVSNGNLTVLSLNFSQSGILCQGLDRTNKIQFVQQITLLNNNGLPNQYKRLNLNHTILMERQKYEYEYLQIFLLLSIFLSGFFVIRVMLLIQKKNKMLLQQFNNSKKRFQTGIITQNNL